MNSHALRGMVAGAAFLSLLTAQAQDRTQGRSMVITKKGIVASESPLASQAGATVLAQGGNAIDAMVAANAVMGVVAPMMEGIGGDLFAIVYEARSGRYYGLNASGWAPAALTVDFLRTLGTNTMPQRGIHAVTIPGCVDGWDKLLKRFGRKKFSQVLAPAIRYAEEGFPVAELVGRSWTGSRTMLSRDNGAKSTYLPGGRAPAVGDVFRNPDLAWSYRQIVSRGRDAYYKGPIAQRLLSNSRAHGGVWSAADLAEYACEWVEPISTTYRGWTVYEIPPNGQGIAALMMLNIMEGFPMADMGHNTAKSLHLMIEAKKLAYADMLRRVADPRFARVPVKEMLSKEYAAQRAKLINDGRANAKAEATPTFEPGNDTTYMCAVDSEGNMISLIQSNYGSFGSGIVAPGTGFALQNRGGLFSLDTSHPNVLAGRKRPVHTIIPGMMAKEDVRIAFGVMQGWNQSQAHAQLISNLVDHKMNLQAAIEAPRFTKITFDGNDVQMELRIPADVRAELTKKGHRIQLLGSFSGAVGGAQAVMRDFAKKVNYGASDPRKDGAAIPETNLR